MNERRNFLLRGNVSQPRRRNRICCEERLIRRTALTHMREASEMNDGRNVSNDFFEIRCSFDRPRHNDLSSIVIPPISRTCIDIANGECEGTACRQKLSHEMPADEACRTGDERSLHDNSPRPNRYSFSRSRPWQVVQ